MTNRELEYVIGAIREISDGADKLEADYEYSPLTNEYTHKRFDADAELARIQGWFGF